MFLFSEFTYSIYCQLFKIVQFNFEWLKRLILFSFVVKICQGQSRSSELKEVSSTVYIFVLFFISSVQLAGLFS